MTFKVCSHPPTDRRVLLGRVHAIEDIRREVATLDCQFILLVIADTTRDDGARLVALAEMLIREGASYVCCWGPDCSRLHDCFDEADFSVNGDASAERVLMTTWHENEPLEEAIWFALNSTFPTGAYHDASASVVIVTVGNNAWFEAANRYLANGAPMPDEA